ncbi:MAG: hypothetical protein RL110_919 [Bacteroidota bacterium]|jgi:hypothetical protein
MDPILVFQKIIEQESKTSTYKFALLRAIIDIISAQSPHIQKRQNQVAIPVFLITDKWLFYYWDLISYNYAQIHQNRSLVFENRLREIQNDHQLQNYWDFNKEFHQHQYKQELKSVFIDLAKSLNDAIIKNPAKYIGTSMGNGYNALFQAELGKAVRSTSINGYLDLLSNSPKLLMENSYFEALKIYGGLLSGTNSIIMNWVDFMEKQRYQNTKNSTGELQEQAIAYGKPSPLDILIQSEAIARDTDQIRKFWCAQIESGQPVYCTWSGQQIKKTDDLVIDHAIPFSVLFNNDFWNLLPAKNVVNANKSDKIVSKTQLLASKSRILTAWQQYLQTPALADTFATQCQISLTKAPNFTTEVLLEKFQEINDGYITFRGMESWRWEVNR